MDRREFLATSAAVAGTIAATHGGVAHELSAAIAGKPFGSGHFGEWITDEHGLPAYHYTCDQRTDSHAYTPTHKDFLGPTDHLHAVGNDRLVAVASNYGHVQVRQDEGAPKYLNDYAPEQNRFGGGIGYLTDGQIVLSTYYPGNAKASQASRCSGNCESSCIWRWLLDWMGRRPTASASRKISMTNKSPKRSSKN